MYLAELLMALQMILAPKDTGDGRRLLEWLQAYAEETGDRLRKRLNEGHN